MPKGGSDGWSTGQQSGDEWLGSANDIKQRMGS